MINEAESLKAQLDLANKALIDIAIQLGFDHFADDEVLAAIQKLQSKSEDERDLAIAANFEEMLAKSDRKIKILEDNLDRARADHLEQLRAIAQMLQPLVGRPYNSTENKDGKIYVHVNHDNDFTHAEKNSAIKLIQKVIYANMKRLDPCLTPSSYDDDF